MFWKHMHIVLGFIRILWKRIIIQKLSLFGQETERRRKYIPILIKQRRFYPHFTFFLQSLLLWSQSMRVMYDQCNRHAKHLCNHYVNQNHSIQYVLKIFRTSSITVIVRNEQFHPSWKNLHHWNKMQWQQVYYSIVR